MSNLPKTGHTAAACLQIRQQLTSGYPQENQFRNNWTRPNNQCEGNMQGQGIQGRPS